MNVLSPITMYPTAYAPEGHRLLAAIVGICIVIAIIRLSAAFWHH